MTEQDIQQRSNMGSKTMKAVIRVSSQRSSMYYGTDCSFSPSQ